MHVDRRSRRLATMQAGPRPPFGQHGTRRQVFDGTTLARKVTVDATGCRVDAARQHVSGHERDRVSVGILPGLEAVHPFDDVEPAECRATSRNALALDDGVRAMVPAPLADVSQMNRDIRQSGGRRLGTGTRLRTGQDGYPLVCVNDSVIYRGLHAGQEMSGQLHFTRCGTDPRTSQGSIPTRVDDPENVGPPARLDGNGSVATSPAPEYGLRDHAVLTPCTLSCTTWSASSNA